MFVTAGMRVVTDVDAVHGVVSVAVPEILVAGELVA